MPTIILLDVSLSMCRMVADSKGNSNEIKQLANVGIGILLDYFAQHVQLEYTALVVFSSLWEIKHEFSRHHESIKNCIYDLDLYDKSNLVNAIRGLLNLKLNEWTDDGPVNIIVITDGQTYNYGRRPHDKNDQFHDAPLSELENQFDFPCKVQLVCLCPPQDRAFNMNLQFYKQLVATIDTDAIDCPVILGNSTNTNKQSAIWLPNSDNLELSMKSVEDLFHRLADVHYKPYHSTLTCGNLCSMVLLSPSPTDCLLKPLKNEYDDLKNQQSTSKKQPHEETYVSATNKARLFKLLDEISICGFMPVSEIASPAVTSRHLVVPVADPRFNELSRTEQILTQNPKAYNKPTQAYAMGEALQLDQGSRKINNSTPATNKTPTKSLNTKTSSNESSPSLEVDITKQPSFCVLLSNALKQENQVAICIVGKNDESGDDWYGMLHSQVDSKKRVSLILSLFIPCPNPIPWLPNLKSLGATSLNQDLPPQILEKIGQSANRKPQKSYSSNSVIWLDPESVQADVQKVVRHAKRTPDKVVFFYKELNRIRKAAISYGFYDVLFGLASILEREKAIMLMDQNKLCSQEMIGHIDHAVACLRASLTEGSYDTPITPLANQ